MPLHSDEAHVLTRYRFRERDLIVVLLTRMEGQVRVLARRARGGRNPGTALEPLARITVSYFVRPSAELATLREAVTIVSAFDLAQRPAAWAAGQVVAELALLHCPPGQRVEPAYRLVDRCLAALRAGSDALVVAAYAELWFLRLAGVMPDLGRCGVCGVAIAEPDRRFDADDGTFVCATHRTGRRTIRIGAASVAWIGGASATPVEGVVSRLPADGLDLLAELRRRFTDRDLKSWAHLQRTIES
jgi:DNA repair protein RecO (recombination protein O)